MNTWKMEEMTATEIHRKIEKREITVPKYQRGIVWKEEQRKNLVDSIKKGIPFGSILLYKDTVNNNYRLIDGLQRCNTIYEFISNPAYFFNEDDVDEESIYNIYTLTELQTSKETIKNLIINKIIEWIKSKHTTMQDVIGLQYHECSLELVKIFPTLIGKEREIVEILKPMLKEYIDICRMMVDVKIPSIVIIGDEDILPTVFERINSKGSPLTKWQIYAATWSEQKVRVNRELMGIVEFNRQRYESMITDESIDIDDFDSAKMVQQGELDIFQLIYGFGKLISNNYPGMFTSSSKITDINSIGFNLVNACLGYKNNEIKKLNINLREIVGNDDNINKFLEKIIECIKFVDNAISNTTKFKSNIRDQNSPLHTEMHICSIIASVFINKYLDLTIDEHDNVVKRKLDIITPKSNWKEFRVKFEKNAFIIYLMDILQSNWRGSGDKKLNNIILNSNYYTKEISSAEFCNVLNIWFDTIKKERNEYKKIQEPKEADKAILNTIYSNSFTALDQISGTVFDIEHLATKGGMKKQLERFDGDLRLPLSSIGNLCLLPEKYNRTKKEKIIYDDDLCIENINEIESKYSFTTREDIEWINDVNISMLELQQKYSKFIDKRFEIIKEKIIQILF